MAWTENVLSSVFSLCGVSSRVESSTEMESATALGDGVMPFGATVSAALARAAAAAVQLDPAGINSWDQRSISSSVLKLQWIT